MAKKLKTDEKILLITDSYSDIPDEAVQKGGIVLLPIPVAMDGKSYLERVDFTTEEFYEKLAATKEIPVTSRIPAATFQQAFEEALEQGYTDVIVTTITSKGSGMFESAVLGKRQFLEDHPEALRIAVLDSGTYTLGYGYPIMEAAEMARQGTSAAQIIAFLDDWYSCCEIIFAAYSLEYAKKSGRIPAVAAFVGDVLGLRPLISIIDGETKVVAKIRGDKNVVSRMVEYAAGRITEKKSATVAVYGTVEAYAQDLMKAAAKAFGRAPRMLGHLGACIAVNSGPKTVALVFRGEKRINGRARESDYSK